MKQVIEFPIDDFVKMFNTTIDLAEDRLKIFNSDESIYFETKNNKGQNLEHLYFSIISFKKDIKNILEIGTGIGHGTNILSKLFPSANIFTCDLKKDDPNYSKDAIRKEHEEEFNRKISGSNVVYVETNSFFLQSIFNKDRQFDFIWADGAHCYPALSWDIAYSYNSLPKNGILLIHDYARGSTNVKEIIDYLVQIIPENVYLLPWANYDKTARTVLIIRE